MTEFRFPGTDDESQRDWAPLPFRPAEFGLIKPTSEPGGTPPPKDVLGQVPSTAEVFKALEAVSRRMESLAKSLDCLGYFDDDDGPRAA